MTHLTILESTLRALLSVPTRTSALTPRPTSSSELFFIGVIYLVLSCLFSFFGFSLKAQATFVILARNYQYCKLSEPSDC